LKSICCLAGIRGVHKLFAITAKPPFTIPQYRSALCTPRVGGGMWRCDQAS
jgi:hypothetical protein